MTSRGRLYLALATLAAGAITIATLTAFAPLDWRVGAIRFRSTEPYRALAASAALSAGLLAAGWRARTWRLVAAALLTLAAIASLAMLTRGAPERFPVSDAARIELYTMRAASGSQLLGAYSQFGWSHPGPMLFYWLVPFYLAGGRTLAATAAAGLTLNLLALWIAAAAVARRSERVPVLPLVLVASTALMLWRLPGFVTSVWNPHLTFVPFLSLLCLTAAVLDGSARTLPLVVLVGSFVAQAHVGLAPVGLAAIAAAAMRVAWHAYRDPTQRVRLAWYGLGSIAVAQLVWLLPVAEQVTGNPGNMTRLFHFFLGAHDGSTPTTALAWRIWGRTIAGVLDPALAIPIGHAVGEPIALWLSVLGTVLVLLLPVSAAVLRRHHSIAASLALATFGAAAIAYWSILHVRGAVGDYQVFWMGGIGAISVGLFAAAVISFVDAPALPRWFSSVATHAAVAVTTLVAVLAAAPGMRSRDAGALSQDSERARAISEALVGAWPSLGMQRPMVRIDDPVWAVGAGVILQLEKKGMPLVAEDAALFGAELAPDGSEDGLVVITGTEGHTLLDRKPGVRPVAEFQGVFVDALKMTPRSAL